jgi:hypothetical protein
MRLVVRATVSALHRTLSDGSLAPGTHRYVVLFRPTWGTQFEPILVGEMTGVCRAPYERTQLVADPGEGCLKVQVVESDAVGPTSFEFERCPPLHAS